MNIDPNLPVDKIAALVVSKSSEPTQTFTRNHKITSMVPLPMQQFWGPRKDDLTGLKCGRFTVIGCSLYRAPGKVNTVRWVVRCSCGRYQLLTSKAVKKNHPDTMCVECIRFKRKKDEYYRLGIDEEPMN